MADTNEADAGENRKRFIKILVVDDILYVVKSISKVLIEQGFFVLTATSGREALEKCADYAPDLVTIDQRLPDMTGLHLAERIRKTYKENAPKIIFITAIDEKEEIKSILNLGVNHFLLKPFKKEKLIESVKEALGI